MKKNLSYCIISFILVAVTFVTRAQSSDEQLAIQYFQNGEYEKAAEIFDKIYSKKQDAYIYNYYYQTLLELKDFKELEKVVKKQKKQQPDVQRYKVDLGYVYERENDPNKAKKEYDDVIKNLPAKQNSVLDLYYSFLAKGKREYAVETLMKGRKLLDNNRLFAAELTTIYAQLNQNDKIIEEALSLVKDGSMLYYSEAEKILQNLMIDDPDETKYLAIKMALQKNSQKDPNNACYLNLLYWLYQLHKDYAAAFTLAKSLDKKYKENGERVFHFALVAADNRDYETAVSALNFVIGKGDGLPYYTSAKFELLNVKYRRLTSSFPIKLNDALALETEFKKLLDENGIHSGTSEWIRKYAHLLAFYVNKPQEAISLLNKAIDNAGRDGKEKALYKVDLADIQLYTGDVWEATLNYSQVDKDFPNDTIGHWAKFKNAKLSFYIGEFAWAKSQLDVLRAATTKLIANDAMYFSLLISDNEEEEDEEEDTTLFDNQNMNLPLRYFAKADFLRFQNKDDDALKMLDSVLIISPFGSLTDDVLYQKALILIKRKDYLGAETLLKKITDSYSYDILGDDATFKLAELYDYYLRDTQKAMDYYQKVMREYPGSLYVVDARNRFRTLRGDFTNSPL